MEKKSGNMLLIKSARLVNVESLTVSVADVAVQNGLICAIFERPLRAPAEFETDGADVVNADGLFLLPGLINSHVHIESSHILPYRFGRAMAADGTTSAVCDPHEIVNVAGEIGLDFMLENGAKSPCDLFFMLPSCVPATPFETPGAVISATETKRIFASHPNLLGLGEMMNFPGVLNGDKEVLGKVDAALSLGKLVDGHFPLGKGEALRRYAACGITSDHESVTGEEALEKVDFGMSVFIREGSSAKNLEALLKVVTKDNFRSFSFCNDDITAGDVVKGGSILGIVRKAVLLGFDPLMAVSMASFNSARHFGLGDRGAIEVGKLADMVLVKDLKDFELVRVYKAGRSVRDYSHADESVLCDEAISSSVSLPKGFELSFPMPKDGDCFARVMVVNPMELITTEKIIPARECNAAGLCRLASVDRHGSGSVSYGLATGIGICKGAIAQSIAHDTHNIICVGMDDADMTLAVRRIAEIGGGVVAVVDGKVFAEYGLPYGGLMADLAAEVASEKEDAFMDAVKKLGVTLPSPVVTISFLSLPVIPKLKLTDKGLVNVDEMKFVPLYF